MLIDFKINFIAYILLILKFISMTNTKSSNQSTLIYAGDSSFGSIEVSRIQHKKPHQFLKGLSFSL